MVPGHPGRSTDRHAPRIVDMAPTALVLPGLGAPEDIAGKAIDEVLRETPILTDVMTDLDPAVTRSHGSGLPPMAAEMILLRHRQRLVQDWRRPPGGLPGAAEG